MILSLSIQVLDEVHKTRRNSIVEERVDTRNRERPPQRRMNRFFGGKYSRVFPARENVDLRIGEMSCELHESQLSLVREDD